ncbi:MAG TPA: biotin/lipoyl-containing protein [Candidatus Krumholzibacteria bacterium]|nr:biotin/lipoyl-containing protein [Candidatus Krumholzibacteria bacterium]
MASIVIDGTRREVVATRTKDGFIVTVDGRRYDVSGVANVADGIAFAMGAEAHVARVSAGASGQQVSVGGRTYTVSRDAVDSDRPASARGGDGTLEAPMPGSIIAVNVAVGDHVLAGQPLVVLEAMKMHNEIVSPLDGVVRKVNCRAGERVNFGQVLVEVAADSS